MFRGEKPRGGDVLGTTWAQLCPSHFHVSIGGPPLVVPNLPISHTTWRTESNTATAQSPAGGRDAGACRVQCFREHPGSSTVVRPFGCHLGCHDRQYTPWGLDYGWLYRRACSSTSEAHSTMRPALSTPSRASFTLAFLDSYSTVFFRASNVLS